MLQKFKNIQVKLRTRFSGTYSQSELEIDAQIKFIDGMSSRDIQDALVKTAVEKIDIDAPNWTYVAARLIPYLICIIE